MYPPEPYLTSYVGKTFPEHHLPLHQARHKLSHGLHEWIKPYEREVHTPHSDIRETAEKYYIDVELPGCGDKDKFTLKWTNKKTLLVVAEIKRPVVEGETEEQKPEGESSKVGTADNNAPYCDVGCPVHYIERERKIGTFARAFNFYVDVDHDKIDAKLHHGLLSIVLPKKEVAPHEPAEVSVKVGEPAVPPNVQAFP